jgi:hypothetical protein
MQVLGNEGCGRRDGGASMGTISAGMMVGSGLSRTGPGWRRRRSYELCCHTYSG